MDQIWFIRIAYPDICNNLFNIVMRKDFAPLQYNGAFDVSKLGVVPFSQWVSSANQNTRSRQKAAASGSRIRQPSKMPRVVALRLCGKISKPYLVTN